MTKIDKPKEWWAECVANEGDAPVAAGGLPGLPPSSRVSVDALRVARFFATVKHAGQLYNGVPYTHHLAAVEQVLHRFGVKNEAMLVAAWLHDVVEDTGTKLKEVREMFGDRVAELVGAVTNEPGENRKIRAALTYPKIRRTRGAVTLKLADRIANVEAGGSLVEMYRNEYEDFRRALYTPSVDEAMWTHLDKLLDVYCTCLSNDSDTLATYGDHCPRHGKVKRPQ